jgi:hypothetical protein
MSSGLVAHSPARKRFAADAQFVMPRAAHSPASTLARVLAVIRGMCEMLLGCASARPRVVAGCQLMECQP